MGAMWQEWHAAGRRPGVIPRNAGHGGWYTPCLLVPLPMVLGAPAFPLALYPRPAPPPLPGRVEKGDGYRRCSPRQGGGAGGDRGCVAHGTNGDAATSAGRGASNEAGRNGEGREMFPEWRGKDSGERASPNSRWSRSPFLRAPTSPTTRSSGRRSRTSSAVSTASPARRAGCHPLPLPLLRDDPVTEQAARYVFVPVTFA
jgi:hypothetical protein